MTDYTYPAPPNLRDRIAALEAQLDEARELIAEANTELATLSSFTRVQDWRKRARALLAEERE